MDQLHLNILGMIKNPVFDLPRRSSAQGAGEGKASFAEALNTASSASASAEKTLTAEVPAMGRAAAAQLPGSITGIVMSAGGRHSALLSAVNKAATMDERLAAVNTLTTTIVNELNSAGYQAYTTDSPDKIIIDGTIYDIVRSSRAMHLDAGMQLLNRGDAASHGVVPADGAGLPQDVGSAIMEAGGGAMDLLARLGRSTDVGERRSLGAQIQALVVDGLNAAGFTAEATGSPDKIIVDGNTYDIIRSVNSPGAPAWLQALRV